MLSEVLKHHMGGGGQPVLSGEPEAPAQEEVPAAASEVPAEEPREEAPVETTAAPAADATAAQEVPPPTEEVPPPTEEPVSYSPVATPVPDREEVVYEYGYHDMYEQGVPVIDYHDGV